MSDNVGEELQKIEDLTTLANYCPTFGSEKELCVLNHGIPMVHALRHGGLELVNDQPPTNHAP